MIIKNYSSLAKDQHSIAALKILNAGLESAMPAKYLKKIINPNQIKINQKTISLSNYNSIYLVSVGKAADSMANTVASILDIKGGFIVIPKNTNSICKNPKLHIYKAGHPVPNQTSVIAAKNIQKFLAQRSKNDFVIFLVSGGTSALLALPDEITLKDKIDVTKKLLNSGATIQELNCVRKHLSKIKGGKLVADIPCASFSLVMSDVVGDDLSSIASGLTYFDTSTYSDAIKILKKYNLQNKISKSVLRRLNQGVSGKISETPKKPKIKNHIFLTNHNCIAAMKKQSKKMKIHSNTFSISGDVSKTASKFYSLIPSRKHSCIIFGGETTVKVKGKGKGGRNQELVLRILEKSLRKNQDLIIASVGTDGIDGNTKYAGAITKIICVTKKEIKSYLDQNNSNSFFKKYGGLIKTGPTHTNLMDIGLILN